MLNISALDGTPLSLDLLLPNLVIGLLLSLVVRWHFQRFGSTLSNREEFAQVFPFVCLTTILVISVVKSSLALSLGLVGALSIVRFRTPIKEPEELAYLFLSIAIGLGLGAAQTIPTITATAVILGALAILKKRRSGRANKNLFLSVDWRLGSGDQPQQFLETLNAVLGKHSVSCDLRRFDVREGSLDATYFVDLESPIKLSELTDDLRSTFPSVGVTFIDQNRLPSV